MEPRLKASQASTPIPKDMLAQIQEAFEETFSKQSKAGRFIIEGRIFKSEILVRAGYLPKGMIGQRNFDVSTDFKAGKDDVAQSIFQCVDAAAALMQSFFDDPKMEFAPTWDELKIENSTLYYQSHRINSELEAEADRILGTHSDQLVDGDPNEEAEASPEDLKRMLGVDDEGGESH